MKAPRARFFAFLFAVATACAVFPASASAAVSFPVAIDAAHFPDATFRSMVSQYYDSNHDGVLTEAEAASALGIDVSYKPVASLKGVEYFFNLQMLNCAVCDLTELDVSQNTKLSNLDCHQNSISALDVSMNTSLNYLYCSNNEISELDVRRNAFLVGMNCDYNNLTALDLSRNLNLRTLDCSFNGITELDVSANSWLTSLGCTKNALTELDVGMNTELVNLSCAYNNIGTLDLQANTKLQTLSCASCGLDALDLSRNRDLQSLACGSNRLPSLDLTGITKLYYLDCGGNLITQLDASLNPGLFSIGASNNRLTSLLLPASTTLYSLSCGNNLLTSLDISRCPSLSTYYCSNNRLTSINVSANPQLSYFYCDNNLINTLNLQANTKISFFNCSNNDLTRLDLRSNTNIYSAYANTNHLLDAEVANPSVTAFTNQQVTVPIQASVASSYRYESTGTYDVNAAHTLTIDSPDAVFDPVTGKIYTDTKSPVGFRTTVSSSIAVTGTISFTVGTATVTFVDWDGTVLDTQVVDIGDDATTPSEPTRAGYTFVGWSGRYTDVTEDSTVTAVYKLAPQFVVTFVDWDGAALKIEAVNPNGSATPPPAPAREGYTFAGWDGTYTDVTKNETVTATYTINRYTVTFVDWDNTVLKTEDVQYGGDATPPADPARAGHTFTGWSGEYTNITDDAVVQATYTPDLFTIAFRDWDGTELKTEVVEYGNDATPPDPPSHPGYDFAYWSGSYTDVTEDGTVVATYAPISYVVNFVNWNGVVLKSQVVGYGEDATPPPDPARAGHIFAGWDGSYTDVTEDRTVRATFTVNSYTVTFVDWDNTVLKTEAVEYRGDATPPPDPTREGYTFAGWDGSYTDVLEDRTVTATYTENPTPPTPPNPPTPPSPPAPGPSPSPGGGGSSGPGGAGPSSPTSLSVTGDLPWLIPALQLVSAATAAVVLLASARRNRALLEERIARSRHRA